MTDTTVTNELILEVLKSVQGSVSAIKADLSEVKTMQLRMRHDFNRFEGDLLRMEQMLAVADVRLDRIEQRLELTNA